MAPKSHLNLCYLQFRPRDNVDEFVSVAYIVTVRAVILTRVFCMILHIECLPESEQTTSFRNEYVR